MAMLLEVLVVAALAVVVGASSTSGPTTKPQCAPDLQEWCQCAGSGREYTCRAAGFTTVPDALPVHITKL